MTQPDRPKAPFNFLWLAFVVAIAAIALNMIASLYTLELLDRSASEVVDAQQAIDGVDNVVELLTGLEAGQRGYLLTGDSAYLKPYHVGERELDGLVEELPGQFAILELPTTNEPLAALLEAVEAKRLEMKNTLQVFEDTGGKAALSIVTTDVGLKLMQDVKEHSTVLRRRLHQRADDRRRSEASGRRFAASSTLLGGLAAILLFGLLFLYIDRLMRLRRQAHTRADAYAMQLSQLANVALELNQVRDRDSLLGLVASEARRLMSVEVAVAVVRSPTPSSAVSVGMRSRALAQWSAHLDPLPVALEAEATSGFAVSEGEADPSAILAEPSAIQSALAVPLVDRTGQVMGHLVAAEPLMGVGDEVAQRLTLVQLGQLLSVAWENVQLLDELQSAADEREDFMAMLGHELRNPLNAISGASQILARRLTPDDPTAEVVAMLDRQSTFMRQMVDDLLDVARLQRGKFVISPTPMDVARMAREVADDFTTGRPDGSLLEARIPATPVYVQGDAARLSQVVTNLLDNAAKFGDGKAIELAVETHDDTMTLTVRDFGAGMSPELQSTVFDRYAQGKRSGHTGLGLGLSLVRGVIELHGGTIDVHSDGEGTGSTFTCTLTTIAPPETGVPLPPREVAKPRRILVVDDRADARLALSQLLESDQHDVLLAENGREAIESVGRHAPSVVFCDISMGDGMNGYEVARHLRAMPEHADLRLVALTGFGTHVARERSLEAGFDRHLTKPVELDLVRDVLAAFDREDARG